MVCRIFKAQQSRLSGLLTQASILVFLVGASAQALVNVDFERDTTATVTYTGAGPNGGFGSAGDVWNSMLFTPGGFFYENPSLSNLVDSAGSATGVDFTTTGAIGAYRVDWMGTTDLTQDGLYVYPGLVGYTYEGYYSDPQVQTTATDDLAWELSGLAPGGSYQMANYSSGSTSYNLDMTIDTDGDGDLGDEIQFTVVADEFPAITSIIASAGGTIIGSATTAAGVSEGHWSGFQLIPEPATICLLGLGGLVLRRRRS